MDTNPIADIPPARHAVESDDEDEFDCDISRLLSQDSEEEGFEIEIRLNDIEDRRGKPLLIACGDAGRVWAQGAGLIQHEGVVLVNNSPFGWIYTPSWAGCDCTVILSEPLSGGYGGNAEKNEALLPLAAMHPYAEEIIRFLAPTRIVLLDTYALPTYIQPIGSQISSKTFLDNNFDHPVRYLTIGLSPFSHQDSKQPSDIELPSSLQRFDPPNLLHSTSASFMNIVDFQSAASSTTETTPIPTLLLLLPSPHISPQPNSRPRRIGIGRSSTRSSNSQSSTPFDHELYPYPPAVNPSSDDPSTEWWNPETMCFVEQVIFRSLGGDRDSDLDFERRRGWRWGRGLGEGRQEGSVKTGRVRNVAIGEGGMYI